jgi:hypothetical protein
MPPTRRARWSNHPEAAGPVRSDRARLRAQLEPLESRTLLSGAAYRPTFIIQSNGSLVPDASPGPVGLTPAQVRTAYGINAISVGGVIGDGSGQTVAIVDAYDWPTAAADLHNFDVQFGLPDPPSFTKVNENGGATLPPTDPGGPGGWSVEEALDVEWVHSIAPMANIVLVEANAPTDLDLVQTAVNTARNLPGVSAVSMSFGRGEFAGTDPGLNSLFTTPAGHNGVTFLASTGDNGAPGGYPAYSPNVVAVGGTSLFLNPDNSYNHEVGWSGSGGGVSTFEPKPAYQSALPYANRSIPDVASDADPNTGVAVYDSYDFGAATPWAQIGGTSLACPTWAGLIAIVNQERVAQFDPTLDGPTQTLPLLYSLPSTDFHDITTGNNGHAAGPGYDLVTGLGSPNAPSLVTDLTPLRLRFTPTTVTGATMGTPLSNVQLGTFTENPALGPVTSYTAMIAWGDGTVTAGTIQSLGNGNDAVLGSHTYATAGTFSVTVTLTDTVGHITVNNTSPLVVADSPITAQNPSTITARVDQTVSTTVTFSTPNTKATVSNYSATISWGDGSAPLAVTSITAGATPGTFSLTGSYSYPYATGSFYPVTVTITSKGGSTATAATQAYISDYPIAVTAGPIPSQVEGSGYSGAVATFSTADPQAQTSNYIAMIDWGDSVSTAATITANGGGNFTVSSTGTHAYSGPGTFPVKVTVVSLGGVHGTGSTTAAVKEAPIVGTPGTISTVAGTAFSGVLGTFTQFALTPAAAFTATVNWGDGTTSLGTVLANAGGTFTVSGGHTYRTYAPGGSYHVAVAIRESSGNAGSFTATAAVPDAGLGGTGAKLSAVQGSPVTAALATFTSANPFSLASQFTALVNWGDGTAPTLGVVSGSGGKFTVSGTHTYAAASAAYPVAVSFQDTVHGAGGSSAVAVSSAHVLARIIASMSSGSDTGVSNADGVTSVNAPVFTGTAEPGAVVQILAVGGGLSSLTPVGAALADALGHYAIQISPLGAGSYVMFARELDPTTAATVETVPVSVTPSGSAVLTIANVGPTVAGVTFDPGTGQLHVVINIGVGGINPAGLLNPANYVLSTPTANGASLTPITPRGLTLSPAGAGKIQVNISYAVSPGAAATYVVTLKAAGLTDLAGNILHETYFVAFPQTTNSPNPNYIAEIDVTKAGVATAPRPYVSIPEQIAAYNYARRVRGLGQSTGPQGPLGTKKG